MSITYGTVSVDLTGRCDDGADERLFSPKLAELVTRKGIGKRYGITPSRLQVVFQNKVDNNSKVTMFRFSK